MYPNEPRASAGVLTQFIKCKGRQILIHSEYYRRHDYHSYSLHCIPYCSRYCCMRVTKGSACIRRVRSRLVPTCHIRGVLAPSRSCVIGALFELRSGMVVRQHIGSSPSLLPRGRRRGHVGGYPTYPKWSTACLRSTRRIRQGAIYGCLSLPSIH